MLRPNFSNDTVSQHFVWPYINIAQSKKTFVHKPQHFVRLLLAKIMYISKTKYFKTEQIKVLRFFCQALCLSHVDFYEPLAYYKN